MSRIAKYLFENYYAKYHGPRVDIIPTPEQLETGIANHPEKVIVIDDGNIRGVAIFLTLTDETYANLESIDITDVEVLKTLIPEQGRNVHFVLLAADNYKTIMAGVRKAMALKPKTVSWFDPNLRRLHKYNLEV